MDIDELRKKSIPELQELEKEKSTQLRNLRFDLASGKVKNVRKVRKLRKNIARIKTIINEKKSKAK